MSQLPQLPPSPSSANSVGNTDDLVGESSLRDQKDQKEQKDQKDQKTKRITFTNKLKQSLWINQFGSNFKVRCPIASCNTELDPFNVGPKAWEICHIESLKRGGTNNPANLKIACKNCNRSMQDRNFHEYESYVNSFRGIASESKTQTPIDLNIKSFYEQYYNKLKVFPEKVKATDFLSEYIEWSNINKLSYTEDCRRFKKILISFSEVNYRHRIGFGKKPNGSRDMTSGYVINQRIS